MNTQEELKSQLSESLPSAVNIMAKAVGVSTKELFKMMEQGQLVSSEVLPKFAKQLKIATREGGALEAGLKTSRVAMQRFGTAFKLNILDSFDAGLESGLGEFFNNLTTVIDESAPLFRVFGKIIGSILSGISTLAMMLTQLVRPVKILFDALIVGGEDGETAIDSLVKAFKTLMFWIVAPWAALQKLNNWIGTLDTSAKILASGGLAAILFQLRGILSTMIAISTLGLSTAVTKGVGGAAKAISGSKAVKNLSSKIHGTSTTTSTAASGLSRTLGIVGLIGAGAMSGKEVYDWWNSPLTPAGPGEIPSFSNIVKNFAQNGFNDYPTSNQTVVNIQVHDTEAAAQALRPYLTGQIDERFDYKALTSMNPAAGG